MNPKERFPAAFEHRRTDRLPVTTHHLMPSFLNNFMNGASNMEFFEHFELHPMNWQMAYTFDPKRGEYFDPEHTEMGFLEARRVISDNWIIRLEKLEGYSYPTQRFNVVTPDRTLSMILQPNEHTTWVKEHLIKEKKDIDIIAKHMTYPLCDMDQMNQKAEELGSKGLFCGHIMAFEGFGQPGCWQDVDLAEAKRRIGDKGCMIVGFDQFHFLKDCTEEETRAEVRRCFEAAGQGGGFILSPSDHFFDADLNLIHAFADEGRKCVYHD